MRSGRDRQDPGPRREDGRRLAGLSNGALTGFEVTLSQAGEKVNAEAGADATSLTVDLQAAADCGATVTPVTADGPQPANASFEAPVPFPPKPIDPGAGRPVILRACSDGTTVSVNWLPSTIDDLLGYYLTITENGVELETFEVSGAAAIAVTVDYVCKQGSAYTTTLTPYDIFGPDYAAVSYSQAIPYPAAGPAGPR
jgi:hypothetical protein